ncbi:MAG: ATP synthase subunit I [Polaromonas sp.]
MIKITNSAVAAQSWVEKDLEELAANNENYKRLTREEVRQLREDNPSVSPWLVLAGQLIVGVLAACAAWAWTGRSVVGWSALYGVLVVVMPAALFLRGLKSQFSSLNAATASFGFFVWEAVKIGVSVALLIAAPRLIPDLNWLAMMVGLVLTLKMYWLALWLRPKK